MNPRYAILHHTGHGPPHYDLLLATVDSRPLLAWRSPVWPLVDGTPLTRLPDHRRTYLTYEGPVATNRGTVRRVAEGLWRRLNAPGTSPIEIHFDEDPAGWRLGDRAIRLRAKRSG